MSSREPMSRRAFLRGAAGAAVGLPWLEAMVRPALCATPARAPVRLAFLYVPNGIHMPDWTPAGDGVDFTLPFTLEPLAPFRRQLTVISGLTADKARGGNAGNHARGLAAFLTGTAPKRTSGADIRAGVSADQVAARTLGRDTRLPSLELGIDPAAWTAACDNGYSCVYTSTMSWRGPTGPVPKEIVPRFVFDRLFVRRTARDRDKVKEDLYRNSILDFVREDAARLRGQVGPTDQAKLDEYLSSIREVELRIEKSERESSRAVAVPEPPRPPQDYTEHLRVMMDLLALALVSDSTRVATFLMANEFSNRNYRFIDAPGGHHELSHHGNDPRKHAKLRLINRWHIEQFAYLLERLRDFKEGEATLLDNCLIAYGSGCSDGNTHNHADLPILLAGSGGGTVKAGRHIRVLPETPVTNLWLAMLDRAGANTEPLGDSTGPLAGLGES